MDFPVWADTPQKQMAYLLRYVALRHNQSGSFTELAVAIGASKHVFYTAIERGQTTTATAAALELLLGRHVVQREMLCPSTATQ